MRRVNLTISIFLDYIWLFGILIFTVHNCSFPLTYYPLAFILLPLINIPIELLSIKLFKTTLGKFVFGLFYERNLTWQESAKIAVQNGVIRFPLFIPIVNIAIAGIYWINSRSKSKKKVTKVIEFHLVKHRYSGVEKGLMVLLTVLVSATTILPDVLIKEVTRYTSYTPDIKIKYRGLEFFRPSEWFEVEARDKSFVALFPSKPTFEEKDFPIPKSNETLVYKEHTHDDHPKHTIGSLELPRTWTKWGSYNVLKGAIQFLSNGSKVIQKQKSTHENFPSLEYEMRKGELFIVGKLVLVESILYKLEVECDHCPSETEREVAATFFNSFHPLLSQS